MGRATHAEERGRATRPMRRRAFASGPAGWWSSQRLSRRDCILSPSRYRLDRSTRSCKSRAPRVERCTCSRGPWRRLLPAHPDTYSASAVPVDAIWCAYRRAPRRARRCCAPLAGSAGPDPGDCGTRACERHSVACVEIARRAVASRAHSRPTTTSISYFPVHLEKKCHTTTTPQSAVVASGRAWLRAPRHWRSLGRQRRKQRVEAHDLRKSTRARSVRRIR